jgi:hypothetical protein
MSEADVRQVLTEVGRPLHGRSIEAKGAIGVPDWNCVTGWIECKLVTGWPKTLRLPHPKRVKAQAIWLLERWRAGGKAHAVLVVGEEWLVLDAPTFFDLAMRGATRDELIDRSVRHWPRLDRRELLDFLQEVRTP